MVTIQKKNDPDDNSYFSTKSKVVFLYVIFNFFFTIYLKGNASVDYEEGKYLFNDGTDIVKEVSKNVYYQYEAYSGRMSTGHFIAFYCLIINLLSYNIKTMESNDVEELN